MWNAGHVSWSVSARLLPILVVVAGCASQPSTPHVAVTVTKATRGYQVRIGGFDFGSSRNDPGVGVPRQAEALSETIDGRSYSGLESSVATFRVKVLAADAKNGDGMSLFYDGTLPFDLEVVDETSTPPRKFRTNVVAGKGEIVVTDGQLKP